MTPWITFIVVTLLIAAVLFGGLEWGFRLGLRARRGGNPMPQLGAMQGATLGLLGLLLGFSFSGAASRFIERQDIIVREGNAIGTAYLRADLLPAEHRDALRAALRVYTEHRIQLFESIGGADELRAHEQIEADHAELWRVAMAGVTADRAIAMAVLPPVNEVIDLLGVRNAATNRHLPRPVLGLLVGCSMVALGLIGYGCGRDGKRQFAGAGSLAFLIAASLWVTIDLDNPRLGMIRVGDEPLRTALKAMR